MIYVSDRRRVRESGALALAVHGALFGALLLLRFGQPAQNNRVLTHVEFLDRPGARGAPAPAARPRNISDFLRMAMPQSARSTRSERVEATDATGAKRAAAKRAAAANNNDSPDGSVRIGMISGSGQGGAGEGEFGDVIDLYPGAGFAGKKPPVVMPKIKSTAPSPSVTTVAVMITFQSR